MVLRPFILFFTITLVLHDIMIDDTNCSLDELLASRPTSIVSELVSIQRCQERSGRNFSKTQSIRCLSCCKDKRRQGGDQILQYVDLPGDDGNFAAVSYVWHASAFEDPRHGDYTIKSKSGRSRRANVRNTVMQRVLRYIISEDVSSFWIDQECINQRNDKAKDVAIQTMDVIYRRSHYPIGMLSTPLRWQEEIDILFELLKGDCVRTSSGSTGLSLLVDTAKAERIVLMLFRLLCDAWWSRRWIFQEEYCSMGRMRLLIPHSSGLYKQNDTEVFGNTANELVVSASGFRAQTTRFCIAYLGCDSLTRKASRRRCLLILKRAKSYMMLRKYGWQINDPGRGLVMSTRILADLCRRSGSIPSDMLAIMSNSCGYAARLQSKQLEAEGFNSLSLAILALFVLNGEILQNWQAKRDETVVEVIKRHSFQQFDPPANDHHLTFMKRCRLPAVVLYHEGVETRGYVWRTCALFKAKRVSRRCHKTDDWRVVLAEIADDLPLEHNYLKRSIKNYLRGVFPTLMSTSGLQTIFRKMTEMVVQAAKDGRRLALAVPAGHTQASAVFLWKGRFALDMSIFTTCEPADDERDRRRCRFLDKFVSLSVDLDQQADDDLPHLRPRGWINGIWFPGPRTSRKVMFPWPASLRETTI